MSSVSCSIDVNAGQRWEYWMGLKEDIQRNYKLFTWKGEEEGYLPSIWNAWNVRETTLLFP